MKVYSNCSRKISLLLSTYLICAIGNQLYASCQNITPSFSAERLSFSKIRITNTSTQQSKIDEYEIQWGDGFSDPGLTNFSSETHSYTSKKLFTITLIITDDANCKDTFSLDVDFRPPLIFFKDSVFCTGETINLELDPIRSKRIDDIDSFVLNIPALSIKYVYSNTPSFTINRKVYRAALIEAEVTLLLRTGDPPPKKYDPYDIKKLIYRPDSHKTDFTPSQDTIFEEEYIDFINFSKPPDSLRLLSGTDIYGRSKDYFPSIYSWDFGDGGTAANDSTPTYQYNTAGKYRVTLEARGQDSVCPGNTFFDSIVVLPKPNLKFLPRHPCSEEKTDFEFDRKSNSKVFPIDEFRWNFGDTSNLTKWLDSADVDETHTYNYGTNYSVTLHYRKISWNNINKRDTFLGSVSQIVKIQALNAKFSSTDTCEELPTTFSNQTKTPNGSTGITDSWNYGDGNTALRRNLLHTHTYDSANTYFTTLTVTSNEGCTSSFSDSIHVKAKPRPNFYLSGGNFKDTNCSPHALTFYSNTIRNIDSNYARWFVDGVEATTYNDIALPFKNTFVHENKALGTRKFSIKLEQKNGCGLNSTEKSIFIRPPDAEANFAFSKPDERTGCEKHTVKFVDKSQNASRIEYITSSTALSKNDIEVASTGNYEKEFKLPGIYFISQRAYGSCGSKLFTLPDSIQIFPTPTPSIDLSYGNANKKAFCTGDVLNIKAQDTIYSKWLFSLSPTFTDSIEYTGRDIVVSHEFTDTLLNIKRDDTTVYLSLLNEKKHIYLRNGKQNEQFCSATTTATFNVHKKPEPTFTSNTLEGCSPLNVTVSHSEDKNANYAINWRAISANRPAEYGINTNTKNFFFENKSDSSKTKAPVPKVWTITMEIKDTGCTLYSSQKVKVNPVPKSYFHADFTNTKDCFSGEKVEVTFNNTSRLGNHKKYVYDLNDSIEFNWEFENKSGPKDQLSVKSKKVKHEFTLDPNESEEDFEVRLNVKNRYTCTDYRDTTITIFSLPEVNFSSPSINVCEGNSYSFEPSTKETDAMYIWTFRNLETKTVLRDTADINSQILKKSFSIDPLVYSRAIKSYSVKLTAIFPNQGCTKDTTIDSLLHVHQLPDASFTKTPDSFLNQNSGTCYFNGLKVMNLNATTSKFATRYNWTIAGTTHAHTTNPLKQHSFKIRDTTQGSDTFEVILEVLNANGCKSTNAVSKNVVVKAMPFMDYSPLRNRQVCEGDTVELSAVTAQKGATYEWKVDNTIQRSATLSHICKLQATPQKSVIKLSPKLTISLPNGCVDSLELKNKISVYRTPEPYFFNENEEKDSLKKYCFAQGRRGLKLNTNSSKYASHYRWSVDSKLLNDTNALLKRDLQLDSGMHTQIYKIELRTYNALWGNKSPGCWADTVKYLEVNRQPAIEYDTSFAARIRVCEGSSLLLQPNTWQSGASYQWKVFDPLDTSKVLHQSNKRKFVFTPQNSALYPAKSSEFFKYRHIMSYGNGCFDSLTTRKHLRVYKLPKAKITDRTIGIQPDGCFKDGKRTIELKSSTSNYAWKVLWFFSDGDSSELVSLKKSFIIDDPNVNQQNFSAKLVAYNDLGCGDSLTQNYLVKRSPSIDLPALQLDDLVKEEICNKSLFEVSPATVHANSTFDWEIWPNGDSTNPETSSLPKLSHTINLNPLTDTNETHTYRLNLYLRVDLTDNGCYNIDTFEKDFLVYNLPVGNIDLEVINPTEDDCYTDGRKRVFLNAVDSSRFAYGYDWDFGDDNSIDESSGGEYHTYRLEQGVNKGLFTAKLTTYNKLECSTSTAINIPIDRKPKIDIGLDEVQACNGEQFCLNTNSKDSHSVFTWSLEDRPASTGDSSFCETLLIGTDSTEASQSFDMHIEVRLSDNGCKNELSLPDKVIIYQNPMPSIQISKLIKQDDGCYYDGLLPIEVNANGSYHTDEYAWKLSDGATTSGSFFNHNLQLAQGADGRVKNYEETFVLSLDASNFIGCRSSLSKDVVVKWKPKALLSLSDTNVCEGEIITFKPGFSYEYDIRQQPIYQWQVSDGTLTKGYNFSTSFSLPNGLVQKRYSLELSTSLPNGCADTIKTSEHFWVKKRPKANFTIENVRRYEKVFGELLFRDASNTLAKEPLGNSWQFGDGSDIEINQREISHRYLENTKYQVIYEVLDNNGCKDTLKRSVTPAYFYGLYMPDAMLPITGVGEQRLFLPKGYGLTYYRLEIYDLNGGLLWSTEALTADGSPVKGWDGYKNGVLQPEGVYLWAAYASFGTSIQWEGSEATTRDGQKVHYKNGKFILQL